MIMIKNKYSLYKPSGIDWIGDIPENWNTLKLKHEYKIQKGRIPKTIFEKMDKGLVPYLSMEVLRGSDISSFVSNDDGVIVKEGQILILWDGSNSGEIIKVEKDGILSSTMGVLNKIGNKLNENFSFYQLKSNEPEIRNNTNGMGIPHVDGQYIRSLVLLTPPLQEQEQIVKYLDEKTSIIDKLISTKERKIELLKEQRTSLINEVITKGLNPNVKMKDSGVEWIGDIPESWEIVPLFTISKHTKEKNEDDEKIVLSLSYGKIKIRDVESNYGLLPESFNDYQRIRPGYIVLRLTDLQNDKKSLRVGLSKLDGIITPVYVSLKTNQKMLDEFLFYHLYNSDLKKILYTLGGGLRQTLRFDELKKFPIPFTTLEEQKEIVEYINKHINEIDDLVSLEQKKIELLKEYRQSLISEVITGKIKVVE